jgi:hypothetical protein
VSQEPPAVCEALSGEQEAMSVVDRVALRLLRIKAYGTLESERYDEAAASQWRKVLYDHERAEWQRAARELLADIAGGAATATDLPRDWRAAHIPPGTPFWDEPSETQPPGWFVFGGFTEDQEEGAAFVLSVEQALDRDETGMSLGRLAKAVAEKLNGGVTA